MNDTTTWGIHAGRSGEGDRLFRDQSCVALGWVAMGDLSQLPPTRDAFREKFVQAFPLAKPGGVATASGIPFRFLYEMKVGDLVVYPSKVDKQVHVGRISGAYRYDPAGDSSFPHRRSVQWLARVPRLGFSQGALYEIGSALSFFMIRNYADEYRAAAQGRVTPTAPLEEDDSVAAVAEDIEESTRDFVLKRLSQQVKGLPFEDFVVHLLQCMGYQARKTLPNEPSVDVIAHKDLLGIEPPIIKVQVKSSEGTASDKDVSALYGKLSTSEYGLFMTLGGFSSQARNFEQSKANLRLIDGDEFVQLVLQHYERFDSTHKGLLPLKRVYVPQSLDSA